MQRDRALIAELTQALRAADADEAARSVVITGTPPAFCAGLDLREVAATTADQAEHDASALLELFETIDNLSKPVIAAVNGPAVAGGAGLVSVCDIVICGKSGVIGYPEIKRGLVAAIVMTRRRVGGESRREPCDTRHRADGSPTRDTLGLVISMSAKAQETGWYGQVRGGTR